MMENMGLEQTLHMRLLWSGLCWQIFQFCYSLTPCKGVELNSMKRKDWALVSFFNISSTFFLRNT